MKQLMIVDECELSSTHLEQEGKIRFGIYMGWGAKHAAFVDLNREETNLVIGFLQAQLSLFEEKK